MSGSILSPYRWQMFYNGSPASGAKLYSYLSGTATPQALYSDSALGSAITQPVEADTNGVFPIMYMAAVAYRITITTSTGTTIFAAQDNIYDLYQIASVGGSAGQLFLSAGASTAPGFSWVPIDPSINDFRLTLTTGLPVTTADVTAATTIYWTPCGRGNRIALYDSSGNPTIYTSAQLSLSVVASTDTNYDVFAYSNSGTPAIEALAWTNATTRATAVTVASNGVYCKSGDMTRRYIGTYRTTGVSGQTEDSYAKRFLWNYYNQVERLLRVVEGTDSWTYSTTTWRQARASTANQLACVVGIAGAPVSARVVVTASVATTAGQVMQVGIAEDATTAPTSNCLVGNTQSNVIDRPLMVTSEFIIYPVAGYHFYAWLENSSTSGGSVTTWAGDLGLATNCQSGIEGKTFG